MQKRTRQGVWIAVLLIASLAAPAMAFEPMAQVNAGAAGLEWTVQGTWDRFVLTVSTPDGSVIRKEFKGSEAPSLSLFDKKGASLPDGSYTWELQTSRRVDKKTREAIAAARRAGDTTAEGELTKALPRGVVQSGSFAIANGTLYTPGPVAEPATSVADRDFPTKDQVIPDDLIVQGSGCFGFDCVNNESFGFDTIRLKENNLRIKFEDTSVGTFPTNDWQLTANDSASGGANKFSIEDITGAKVPFTVTAGAATNSIFVDSTGRVGFRTATPVLDLHVSTSNTPAIRLEQTNAGGFTAQTWDIAGNEANFFVRDVTGGSRLSFRIRPGAPTSSIDISADGDVGVGTASPDTKLHVLSADDENEVVLMENTNSTGTTALAGYRAQADDANISFQSHGSGRTLSRFGTVLGGWGELLQTTGDGLILGTLNSTNLILGTNSTKRIEIAGAGGVTVTGNFTVTGGTKNFAMVDPADATKAIYYAALEGPEAGTYFRGTAKTVDGKVVIELPSYFSKVTEGKGITVQLTPTGGWSQLYVEEKSPTRLVVRVAPGNQDVDFDFFVQGVRAGYSDFQVERPNDGNIQ
jgi:hypothetical protein